MDNERMPANVGSNDGLGLVATDAATVRRDLMAMSRCDAITDRHRVTIGAAIGLIGKEIARQAEVAALFARDCDTCAYHAEPGDVCSNCYQRINWKRKA